MITLWYTPHCSKSRQALALIEAAGVQVRVRKYLDDPADPAEIDAARRALGAPAVIDMMRRSEARFGELGLDDRTADADLIRVMAENPILIGRPPEAIKVLL